MTSDSFSAALGRLDPASRALLDLSLRRGMQTEEIAEVLGADPWTVAHSRDEALRRVAADVGMDSEEELDEVRARLAELPADEWLGEAAHDDEPEPEPEPEREPRRPLIRPQFLWALGATLLLAGIAWLASLGTPDEESTTTQETATQELEPTQTQTTPQPKPKPKKAAPPPVRLTAIGGTARGTAHLNPARNRLILKLSGLPDPGTAVYTVWLYSSVIEARPVASTPARTLAVNAPLPKDWRRYRYVDISREPADGNPSHSGESVARVPTRALR